VPNVVSESVAIATRELGDVGLSVGIQTQQCSDTAENDTVTSTSPQAGREVQPGSAVNLVESSGSCLVIVPDVIGETESQASAALNGQGLAAEPAAPAPSQKCGKTDIGKVVGQSPSGNTSVSTDAPVTINVCGITG
jgi:beta-lactam-binding protein with PASTA domain